MPQWTKSIQLTADSLMQDRPTGVKKAKILAILERV